MTNLILKDQEVISKLLDSKQLVYDYVTEKKGYYLDSINTKAITNKYLEGLLLGNYWAPTKSLQDNWQTGIKNSKIEIFYALMKIEIPDNKTLGLEQ